MEYLMRLRFSLQLAGLTSLQTRKARLWAYMNSEELISVAKELTSHRSDRDVSQLAEGEGFEPSTPI